MTECNYFLFIYLVSRFICVFIPIYAQISLIGSALVLGYTLSEQLQNFNLNVDGNCFQFAH